MPGTFDYVEFLGEYSPYDLSALENSAARPSFTTSER